jgi:hypothetical protein
MSSKRRPLPYHASMALDDAKMESTLAIKSLLPLVDGNSITAEEKYRRIAKAIYHIQQSIFQLDQIKREREQ